jgi:hypothetical protein
MIESFYDYSTKGTFQAKSFVTGVIFGLPGSFSPATREARLRVSLHERFSSLRSRTVPQAGIVIL